MSQVDMRSDEPPPTVSVVLPTYNRAHCLPRALESVLRQTYEDIEVIVVDDCSTDATQSYLAGIKDPRLRVLKHEKNKGGGGARNTGIAAARGELVAFQDSDDEWLVTKLARQVEEYRKNTDPAYGAIYCGKLTYGEAGFRDYGPRKAYYAPLPSCTQTSGDILHALLANPMISTQTLMVRKDLLEKIGGFDETLKLGQDWDLTIRLARHTKFLFIEEPLGLCFIEPDSISTFKFNQIWMRENILKKNYDLISRDKSLHSTYLIEIARIYQRNNFWRESFPFIRSALSIYPFQKRAWASLAMGSLMVPFQRKGQGQ